MNVLPEEVIVAWKHREGPAVCTTVDSNGVPNSIYVTCTALSDDGTIVIADNYFHKTRKNIENGTPVTVLFITDVGTSYQVKGTVSYHTSGEVFSFMKSWNPEKHPGIAAAAVTPEQVYSGKKQLL